MVGEQPGNEEDLQGLPFVGPAGRILDRALQEAGIRRGDVYVTNAVKHFKFEERGKRRIHKTPTVGEVRACYPWLEAEIRLVRPKVIVCLGATAARSMLGSSFRLTKERGVPMAYSPETRIVATAHPSAVLRTPESEQRHAEYSKLVADLRKVRAIL
jgi:DNA polymerase